MLRVGTVRSSEQRQPSECVANLSNRPGIYIYNMKQLSANLPRHEKSPYAIRRRDVMSSAPKAQSTNTSKQSLKIVATRTRVLFVPGFQDTHPSIPSSQNSSLPGFECSSGSASSLTGIRPNTQEPNGSISSPDCLMCKICKHSLLENGCRTSI